MRLFSDEGDEKATSPPSSGCRGSARDTPQDPLLIYENDASLSASRCLSPAASDEELVREPHASDSESQWSWAPTPSHAAKPQSQDLLKEEGEEEEEVSLPFSMCLPSQSIASSQSGSQIQADSQSRGQITASQPYPLLPPPVSLLPFDRQITESSGSILHSIPQRANSHLSLQSYPYRSALKDAVFVTPEAKRFVNESAMPCKRASSHTFTTNADKPL